MKSGTYRHLWLLRPVYSILVSGYDSFGRIRCHHPGLLSLHEGGESNFLLTCIPPEMGLKEMIGMAESRGEDRVSSVQQCRLDVTPTPLMQAARVLLMVDYRCMKVRAGANFAVSANLNIMS